MTAQHKLPTLQPLQHTPLTILPLRQVANPKHRLARTLQQLAHTVRGRGIDDDDHAQPTVKRAGHLAGVHAARLLQPGKHRRQPPRTHVNARRKGLREHPRDILRQTTSRDMRQTLDGIPVGGGGEGLQDGFGVDPGWRQQRSPQFLGVVKRGRIRVGQTGALDDLADQRVSVGVRARRGQSQDDVAGGHGVAARQESRCVGAGGVDGSDGGADGIVGRTVGSEKTGHFGRFAADQGTAGLDAAVGDAADEGSGRGHVERAARVTVQEEEGLGALHDQVVDVHGHEVDAHGVVGAHGVSDHELGADAVDRADERGRVWVVGRVGGREGEQPAEAADDGVRAGAFRLGHGGLDLVDEVVAGVDGDAGGGVGEGLLLLGLGLHGVALAEGPVRNVLAVEHVVEVDRGNALVALAHGVFQRRGRCGGRDDSSAGRLQLLLLAEAGACVEDERARRHRVHGDGFALGVRVGVPACHRDHRRREVRLHGNMHPVQPVVGARHHDLGQIRVVAEQREQGLRLRVTAAHVVLQHFGSVRGHHESREEDPHERDPVATHPVDRRLHDRPVDLVQHGLRANRRRGVASHPTRVGSLVAVPDPLVVLRRRQRPDRVPVTERKHAELVALQAFFNHDFLARGPELLVHHHLPQGLVCFRLGRRDDHAFAAG